VRIPRVAWVTGSVVVASLALAVALRNGAQADAPGGTESARVVVEVVEVAAQALPGEVRAGGFLRAREDVTVAAERAGRVVALPVAEDADVKAGDVVARLDSTIADAQFERAWAAAREAGLNPNAGAADVEATRAALKVARHEVELRNPASPIDGIVEKHHVDVGEYVVPGTPLVDVLDMRTLVLDVDLDPEVVALESKPTVNGKPVRVRRVANRADPRTRRFRVELEIDEPGLLLPGMHAVARFVLPPGSPAIYVPKAVVRTVQGERGVFVARAGAAAWLAVTVAPVPYRADLLRVTGGALEAGDLLVVRGFSGLRPGMPVEARR
jgi:multidrug efflux pump subunit AcrA (membrane-fusion protein)